jgi:hypothetical protein
MATEKRPTTYRLSEEARALLEEMAARNGISQTAVLELAIRQMARRELDAAPEATPAKKRKKGK